MLTRLLRARLGVGDWGVVEAVEVGFLGAGGAEAAVEEGADFRDGKNEAIGGGVVGLVFVVMHLDEVGGLFELLVLEGFALGLELAEELEGFFELAVKAMAVNAQV